MLEWIDGWLRAVGPLGYLVLALAALLEYVFPPFPGDTVALLGGTFSARGDRTLVLVLIALTVGSLVGMTLNWRLGLALGARLSNLAPQQTLLGVSVERLQKAQALMRQRGGWLLIVNRFLPSFRAVVFVAAGAAGVRLSRTLLLGGLSALAWNGLLVSVGIALGENAEKIDAFLSTYRRSALVVLALVAVGLVGRWAWSRRRRQR